MKINVVGIVQPMHVKIEYVLMHHQHSLKKVIVDHGYLHVQSI